MNRLRAIVEDPDPGHWLLRMFRSVFDNPKRWPVGRSPLPADQGIVAVALGRFLQSRNLQGYMIIDGVGFERFVQFALTPRYGLELDLPALQLSAQKRLKARMFFEQLNVKPQYTFRGHDVYKCDFESDCEQAAETVIRLFREVFDSPRDPRLSISIG